ncbi:hypothetical protein RRG08_044923 [Elysia crispata]|uniref:Uncharacterized protein n=1 Tax=Elysia crispata TaxID=231223 RepID=A0AAE1DLU9_9GAST|nr:hypothetical protein RRG08_044923 [Elysia crispata]
MLGSPMRKPEQRRNRQRTIVRSSSDHRTYGHTEVYFRQCTPEPEAGITERPKAPDARWPADVHYDGIDHCIPVNKGPLLGMHKELEGRLGRLSKTVTGGSCIPPGPLDEVELEFFTLNGIFRRCR